MENHDYGHCIHRLSKNIKYLADDNLVKHNITFEQAKIIKYLSHECTDYRAFQKDIEMYFGIKRSSVTNILQHMEKSNLITRFSDDHDARIKKVQLTEKGKALSKELRDYIVNLEQNIVKGMNEEEKVIFLDLLKIALNNIEKLSSKQV